MFGPKCFLVFVFALTLLLDPIACRKSFGGGRSHYPKSGGLSGSHSSGGSHGYPSSGGLSGNSGGSHGYPTSGGLSGHGNGYPSQGGGHGYPPSGGLSGHGNSYPSHSGGNSGNTHYGNNGYPSHSGKYPSHTTIYNNYHYSPPQQIYYTPRGGGPAHHYPVYQGPPPTYVYQYKDSGSKYGTLLAGLALMNLGTLAVAGYAAHKATSSPGQNYVPQNGEICKFAIKKDNGDYEETKIDCNIISSFILQDQAERSRANNVSTVVTSTTNVTMVNMTGSVPQDIPTTTASPSPQYVLLPNGTLVDYSQVHTIPGVVLPNATNAMPQVNQTANASPNITSSVITTTTTTNTTIVNALDVKGKPVDVTPGMECFVISTSPVHTMKKHVPCRLLQNYADSSIRKNSAVRNGPMFTVLAAIVAVCVAF